MRLGERLNVLNCVSTSVHFYQRCNITHVWDSSACLLILSWSREIKEASPASQKMREWSIFSSLPAGRLDQLYAAHSLGMSLCLRCALLWTPQDLPNPFRPALLGCHHPNAVCKFGSDSNLEASLLQFKPSISWTRICMVGARNQKHFHKKK